MSGYSLKSMSVIYLLIVGMLLVCTQVSGSAIQNDLLFFKFEHTPQDPYLNQQVIYTVKLFQRVPFFDGNYLPPHLDNAVLFPFGDAREYHATLHGEMYTIAEQSYAVFPQKSGMLSVYGPELDAVIKGMTSSKIHLGPSISTLHVKARPLNHHGDWLPAKNVKIKVVDDVLQKRVALSGAIVRTITLSADEVPAELLPELHFKRSAAWDVYVAKPIYKNSLTAKILHGRATYRVTYTLNHPGRVILPQKNVAWFNTGSGKVETASFPARHILVEEDSIPVSKEIHKPSLKTYMYLYALCVCLLVIIGLYLAVRGRICSYRKKIGVLHGLRVACFAGQAVPTSQALICWARYTFPNEDFLTLNDVMDRLHNDDFLHQIQLLLRVLYQLDTTAVWSGQELWRCVIKFNRKKTISKIQKTLLPPLNPG